MSSSVSSSALSATASHSENTGRWTSKEHNLFLQGLKLHGKCWKKIAGLIKSRTNVQVSSHVQRYLQELAPSSSTSALRAAAKVVRDAEKKAMAAATKAAARAAEKKMNEEWWRKQNVDLHSTW
jgi:SHAQKYF class myb-like DNA-binding protein